MKSVIIFVLTVAVFAAPCVYDIGSQEPSALSGLLSVSQLKNTV